MKEQLNGQSENVLLDVDSMDKKNSNSEELVTRKEIENTPFVVVGTEHGYFGVLGKYRLTEPMETEEEAEKATKEITWNRIVQVMMLVSEEMKELNINELNKKQ